MLDVFTYEGNEVRAFLVDDAPIFVAADLCRVLGHSNPTMAVAGLDDDEKGLRNVETPSGCQQMVTVTEAGLYSLILRSRKPEAKAFKRWITHEVLPAIRKTGQYGAVALTDDELMLKALTVATERVAALTARAETAEAELTLAAPKADAFDSFLSAAGDYSVRDAVKVLNRDHAVAIREKALYAWLQDHRWIYRDAARNWCGYADAIASGYVAHKAQWHHHPSTGEKVIDPPQLRITAKGIDRLRDRLTRAA